MQPLPTGINPPLPSINHPGGAPSTDFKKGRRHGFKDRGTSGIYYGLPYYLPYYYLYTEEVASDPYAAPGDTSGYGSSPASGTGYLTLLAFKDSSVVIVVEYWLEGDWLYYITPSGHRLSQPLDRLDQPLTQQLNRERNVPFVLEFRR
jgi:hypothetical protein